MTQPAPDFEAMARKIVVSFLESKHEEAGLYARVTDALRQAYQAGQSDERDLWVLKFEHWVKCAESSKELTTHQYIKSLGFGDCARAMKENDRWIPHAAIRAASLGGSK